jgi:hypothetical protein
LAVATNTRWVPFGHKASAPHSADGRPAQVVDVTLTRWFSGSGTGRRISNELGCARGSTPGRGDFWILKITHAPSPKNVFKNGF